MILAQARNGDQLLTFQTCEQPTLPESELADDHPDRCRIDRIPLDAVLGASDEVLARAPAPPA